jgi:hypothetical protein
MEWINQNWFWLLIGIVFVGMHLFGHGGHGGHGGGHKGHRPSGKDDPDKPQGHQH